MAEAPRAGRGTEGAATMDADEPRQNADRGLGIGEDLSDVSVSDLRDRVSALEREMARVVAEIEKKSAHEVAAAALFKT